MISQLNGVNKLYTPNNLKYKTSQQTETISSKGDSVTISKTGELLNKIESYLSFEKNKSGHITLDSINREREKTLNKVTDDCNIMFLENKISRPPEINLYADRSGNIKVKGNHPDKDKIEKLFSDNPEKGNQFRKLSALTSFVKAANEYSAFAKEYAKNPQQAVAKYAHMFNSSLKDDFILKL